MSLIKNLNSNIENLNIYMYGKNFKFEVKNLNKPVEVKINNEIKILLKLLTRNAVQLLNNRCVALINKSFKSAMLVTYLFEVKSDIKT